MKQVLLTIIYPFWIFLSKTWLGSVFMICLIPTIPIFIVALIFKSITFNPKDIGVCLAILSLLLSPFISMTFIRIGLYLEFNYKEFKYKTEL